MATAAIRRAANGAELISAVHQACGLEVKILSGEEEARLAFVGAAQTLDHVPAGPLGVVDVGGGSSELVVGRAPDQVSWSVSVGLGSGDLADRCLRSDPPSARELAQARAEVSTALAGSRCRGRRRRSRWGERLARCAGWPGRCSTGGRSPGRCGCWPPSAPARWRAGSRSTVERVRLLPAGLLILQAASELFGTALQIGRGGVREGVLLEGGR